MKQGERFTFQPIPPSLRGKQAQMTELVIPIDDEEWWDKKFMTQSSPHTIKYGPSKIWYFMTLNPTYQNKGEKVAYGTPFIFQKMYADIDLERGRGVVGSPFESASTGGSFNPSLNKVNWLSNYDIFIITKESSFMNWDNLPWEELK